MVPESNLEFSEDDSDSTSCSDENQDSVNEDWDDWVEDGGISTRTLIYPSIVSPSVEAALKHDLNVHGFCFKSIIKRLQLDTTGRIKLINWIRAGPLNSRTREEIENLKGDEDWLTQGSAEWLIPRLPDDGMLQFDFDDEPEADIDRENDPRSDLDTGMGQLKTSSRLEQQLFAAQQELQRLKALVNCTLHDDVDSKTSTSSKVQSSSSKIPPSKDDDSHYFSSYAHDLIHATMIQDQVRTNSYRDFMISNPQIFKDKHVMDIGCGTGILSFFAAQAGAKRVFAIDASDIAINAVEHMKKNGLADRVKVINKKVEDLDLNKDLEGVKVDVIVSEWMGYACLYEGFLPSVLQARDRFMKSSEEGGLMAPSQCSILMAGWGEDDWWKNHVTWWDENQYGFKMGSTMTKRLFSEGFVTSVSSNDLLTDTVALRNIHTSTIASQASQCIPFLTDFVLKSPDDLAEPRTLHAFVVWFDTFFTVDGRLVGDEVLEKSQSWKKLPSEVAFSTSPKSADTHWHQTLLVLQQPLTISQGAIITGTFNCSINPDNSRELVICLTFKAQTNPNEKPGAECTQIWTI